MTQMKIREQVIEDLKQYPALKKKIILLRYEQDHPARISDGEVIDSMALSRPVTDGIRSAGFISDKTMRIATQFRDKKERLNQEAVMEIAQELHAVERQISKLEFYVSQLEEKQAEVIRGYYFEGKTWGELQQEMHLSPRTLIKRRDDGLDGLAVGVSSIAAITMLAVALLTGNMPIAITMAALAGACIGFMPYNLNPAKIFMGDTGSTFLGYMLATVSIMGLFKFYAVISFAVPFLILGLPIFDTANAIIRRVAAGRSPMSPDRGHVHHKLIDMGFNQKQAVAILYAISATLGLTAVVLTSSGEVKAIVLLLAVLAAILVGACIIYGAEHWSKHASENKEDKDDE